MTHQDEGSLIVQGPETHRTIGKAVGRRDGVH